MTFRYVLDGEPSIQWIATGIAALFTVTSLVAAGAGDFSTAFFAGTTVLALRYVALLDHAGAHAGRVAAEIHLKHQHLLGEIAKARAIHESNKAQQAQGHAAKTRPERTPGGLILP
jgi:hypothetical protein